MDVHVCLSGSVKMMLFFLPANGMFYMKDSAKTGLKYHLIKHQIVSSFSEIGV